MVHISFLLPDGNKYSLDVFPGTKISLVRKLARIVSNLPRKQVAVLSYGGRIIHDHKNEERLDAVLRVERGHQDHVFRVKWCTPESDDADVEYEKPTFNNKPIKCKQVIASDWRVVWTCDGRVFFYNPSSRKSVAEIPPELIGRANSNLTIPSEEQKAAWIKALPYKAYRGVQQQQRFVDAFQSLDDKKSRDVIARAAQNYYRKVVYWAVKEKMPEALTTDELKYIRLELPGSVKVKALVDFGAQKSAISQRVAQRCDISGIIDRQPGIHVSGIGGSCPLFGALPCIPISLGDRRFSWPVLVLLDPAPHDFLFGYDLWQRYKCRVLYNQRKLRFHLRNGKRLDVPFLSDAEAAAQ